MHAPSRRIILLTAFVLVAPIFAGCLSVVDEPVDPAAASDRAPMDEAEFLTNGSWSQTLEPGPFDRLDPIVTTVESFDGTEISVGIFRPDIPGCPEDVTEDVPEECKVPVIVDAGPYFTPESIGEMSTRPPTSIWFVPHGYAVVQVAVRGTGASGGCMEFMSLNEQEDVSEVVTWLAEQPWSTGDVGMMGRSYDGTTPFMVAALGNPHLKTIVPISGVADVPELMFRNGTSEFRGPIMHNFVYWVNYGLLPSMDVQRQACEEVVEGTLTGAYTSQTGDHAVAGMSDYWEVRKFRERILENYNGSVYIVHGLQDWNVNPSQTVPWFNDLQNHGFKVKGWFGQWEHHYPDRPDEHINVRWDWAETLLRWFDSELKGLDVDTGPIVEVEDHRGTWHTRDSYPPRQSAWDVLTVGADGIGTDASGDFVLYNPMGEAGSMSLGPGGAVLTVESQPFDHKHHIEGLPQLHLEVTPTTSTPSILTADLYDVYPDRRTEWIGHAVLNLRYHEGGNEAQTLTPGEAITAKMEFEPLDAYLPVGHSLRLVLSQNAGTSPRADALPHAEGGPVVIHLGEDSVLRLPVYTGDHA